MKGCTKKIAIFAMILLSVQAFMFSASNSEEKETNPEKMSLLQLNQEVISLKYELYQLEHKFGEYEDMNSFMSGLEKIKLEHKLEKFQKVLERRNAENTEQAKIAAQQAFENLKPELKNFADKSKEFGKQLSQDISDGLDKLSNFFDTIGEE